jgi:O-methyltransferase
MSWKARLASLWRRFGWQLSRDGLVRLTATDGYVPSPRNGYRVYAPWVLPPFSTLYETIRPWTLVSDDRCYILQQFARQCSNLQGDFAECGVYQGGTALLLANTMHDGSASGKLLHLFDTFRGMPEEANRDAGGHASGDFGATSLAAVQSRLGTFRNIRYHEGIIPGTLSAVSDRTFAFLYLDLDLYESTLEALRFFYPRMVSGAAIIGDDYGFPRYRLAAKRAFDEFFAVKPEPLIVLTTGQCLILKH